MSQNQVFSPYGTYATSTYSVRICNPSVSERSGLPQRPFKPEATNEGDPRVKGSNLIDDPIRTWSQLVIVPAVALRYAKRLACGGLFFFRVTSLSDAEVRGTQLRQW